MKNLTPLTLSPPPPHTQGFGAFFTLLWTGIYV
jgi:hypothetical protein